jgi:hypothetical protein
MTIGQTADAAKPGWLGQSANASYRHFFPALRVAFWRTTAVVAFLGKAFSLSVGARLAGSPPQNAMQLVPGWGVRA